MKIKTMFFAALAALTSTAFAQAITPEEKQSVLAAITKNVKERAYVGGVDFSKWDKFVGEHKTDFDKASTEEMFANAVNTALDEFGFSHIQLMTPRAATTRVTGKSVGIGVLIEPLKDGIRITKVIPGGPAEKAGIQIGDIIIKADGEPVNTPDKVRGPVGTKVVITIKRGDQTLDKEIVRAEFSLLVKDELKWLDDKTAMLKINTFSPPGYDMKAIDDFFTEVQDKKAERLIIDLRNNGGGAVPNLAHLAGKVLLPNVTMGKFITRSHAEEFKKKYPDKTDDPVEVAKEFGWPLNSYSAGGRQSKKPYMGELVVLVSPASASASEIFAATVADNKRGKVVGIKSAGAVLASSFLSLPDGWSLQIPLMEYVSPAGKRLEAAGVVPSFTVDPMKINDDEALIAAAKSAFDALKKEETAAQKGGG